MNKSIHTRAALKTLALAGLLAFTAAPAMAATAAAPAAPATPATAASPTVATTPTTAAVPAIDHETPDTSAAEVEVADDIAGGQHIEAPEIAGVSTPEVGTPDVHTPEIANVNTPEVDTPDSH